MTHSIDEHWSSQYATGADFRSLHPAELLQVLTYVNGDLPQRCLDIGCGTGSLTRELYHHGYECTGVDISHQAVEIANKATMFNKKLRYVHANFESDTPVAIFDAPFSLITCKLVYAFISDKAAFLDKVYKIMSDDSVFVIITPIYTQRRHATPISVDKNKTLIELKEKFTHVSLLEFSWATCFICRK